MCSLFFVSAERKRGEGIGMGSVIVIGGGAAGMMAAIAAADAGQKVTLLEKNEKLGKKLFITGKGRCNVTNAGDREAFFASVCSNGKFMYSSFSHFDNRMAMDFFEEEGCRLKTERGERVFPVSDHSSDIIGALQRGLKKRGVKICLNAEVREILLEKCPDESDESQEREISGETDENRTVCGRQKADVSQEAGESQEASKSRKMDLEAGKKCRMAFSGVCLADGSTISADKGIICTGGLSYPATGSTGDGYRFAARTGHRLVDARPALVPFETAEKWCRDLMGLSLKNVSLRMVNGRKELYSGFGEMLFTHFGVSGPLILSASSFYGRRKSDNVQLLIDLKPALGEEQLDRRLLRDFEENRNKQFKNALGALFPAKMIPVMTALSGIHPDKKASLITKEERRGFLSLIKSLPLTVTGTRPFQEAVITRGGVSVKDVNPSTMESKIVKNLYFAGEVLDLDALTGGFNLQIAWSTGHLAGASAGSFGII